MTDDQGWTHIRPKNRRKAKPDTPSPSPAAAAATFTPRTSGPLRTPAALLADHDAVLAEWETSAAHAALVRLADQHRAVAPAIRTAVCLGTGTFDPPPDAGTAPESKRAAHLQLCALSTLIARIEYLAASSRRGTDHAPPPVRRVVQDPILTAADQAFLARLGYTVVDSPAAYPLVDDKTLLFAVHLYRPIYAAALESSLPAIFVGTGWHVWDTTLMQQPADDLKNLQTMDQTYLRYAFPQDNNTRSAFSSTSIYFQPAK